MLTGADLAAHQKLGITRAMIDRMQIRRVDDREARETLALMNGRPGRLDGILYPYLDPHERRPVTHRLRRDHPELENGKPKNKYLSAWGDRRHLYFACDDDQVLHDTRVPVVLVEAEKSVLAARCAADRLARSLLPIGLGGCWGWKGRIGKVETPSGGRADEYGPLADLDRILWTDRDAIVAFDANAASNPKVLAARRALTAELEQRGAHVRVLDLPNAPGVNGPDDYIGQYGDAAFFTLIDAAIEVRGNVPLGRRDPQTGRLVLSPTRTPPTAQAFVESFYLHPAGRRLHSHADVLLEWRDNHYAAIEDTAIKNRLQAWLHAALRSQVVDKRTGATALVPFESNPTSVNNALESIRAYTHLPATIDTPSWLDAGAHPSALELVPGRSATVHVPTRAVLPATPALFTMNALAFDYDAEAAEPTVWLAFLEQLWGDDTESIQLLQEWFGYCLIADTSQQKILLLVGPRRSGKGTIGRILTRLVGVANVVGPTTNSLAGPFGLQALIGKSLAIVSDARFTGENVAIVVERLLCISGEDTLSVDRKFLGAVSLRLSTRFMFLTNELPRLNDASTALAGRFLILQLTQSFYGHEDPMLTDRLSAELSGILLWALEGWDRLHKRGHFVQPASVADAIEDLEDLASPVRPFVRECCTVLADLRVSIDTLYSAWEMWCQQTGRKPTMRHLFGRDLAAAVPRVKRRRGTDDKPFYEGLALTAETASALDRFLKARRRRQDGTEAGEGPGTAK